MMKNWLIHGYMLLLFSLGLALPAAAAETAPYPQIRVSGEGVASLAPDIAVLSLAVTREAPTAQQALDASSSAMREVLAALRKAGIEERDLQTEQFAIQPRYRDEPAQVKGEPSAPRIVGYTVSNALSVRVRDLGRLGGIIDMSVRLGVNQGGGIRFLNEDPAAALSAARSAAMQDALSRARTLTAAADVGLGRILEISEQSYQPRPMMMARTEMMADAGSVPIAGGENSYRVTVNVTFALEQ
ncbi:MAG: SIMPL domain-containing protein [Halieaceae bacterium]|uniref:SIMPL domain-containing protein n=1 Tax=Haliea alexandrii TaxID=2448162 RepID=UPI0018EEC732|nr:SIMPL domain-containing protein [Haliea alexandrii]MCR9183924.1 SIMPL domain-containing protein [Halieaceae bacterium]